VHDRDVRRLALLLLLLATLPPAFAASPGAIALLVNESDDAKLVEPLTLALRDETPLVRATAARIAGVRNATTLLPSLREALATEKDATAAREEIRTLALLGTDEDVATAAAASAKWPRSMDDALAGSIARRGGTKAIELYASTLRGSRMSSHATFMRHALWGRLELVPFAAARSLGMQDANAWSGLLTTLRESDVALPAEQLLPSLDSSDEAIRRRSLRYLIAGFAADPTKIANVLRERLLAPRDEQGSDEENFARELLRRMLGAERKENPRWMAWLDTPEGDEFLGGDQTVMQYLTDAEYSIRRGRCFVQSAECRLPVKRVGHPLPSQDVASPAFNMPDLLPAGLADAVMSEARCRDSWLNVVNVTVDPAGRLQTLDEAAMPSSAGCRRALGTLLRLSYATNTSIKSAFAGPLLLVKAPRATPCLDEPPPQNDPDRGPSMVGGAIKPPMPKKRVEPNFPASARAAMGGGVSSLVIMQCVISRDGCVRNIRLLRQSPLAEINGAAVAAVAQWTFVPGYVDGKPVDVIFNLTVNFMVR
jgi:TonB family protein